MIAVASAIGCLFVLYGLSLVATATGIEEPWFVLPATVLLYGFAVFVIILAPRRPMLCRWMRMSGMALAAALTVVWIISTSYRYGYHYGNGCVMADTGDLRWTAYIYGAQTPVHRWFVEPKHDWGTWWPQAKPAPTPNGYVVRLGKMPFWLLLAGLLTATFHLSAQAVLRNTISPGHCRCCCGYDLTGNISGRCPECGTERATERS